MADTYTQLLGRARLDAAGEVQLYVCPTSDDVVTRHLVVSNMTSVESVVSIIVQAGSLRMRLYGGTLPAGTTQMFDLRQRLVAGDQVLASSSVQPVAVFLTGYVFD